ncbi:hypothetical protein [Agrococcus carbonis]|uniref:Uncharacterized protein n=1 Tax=Agrococcus carbonis TaxID=684552 RepID=A0A1H1LWB2_9MICO|nr:hypothetical protein [Agrococcus carbonis]SDR78697.1 hypothetical protein SAMN04489719_0769 [Agrococcus carbonis]
MSRDEDALRWEGDDELDRATPDDAQDDRAPAPAASAPVVRESRPRGPLGWLAFVLALAATAGWVVIIVANPVQQPSLIGLALYQLGELLAMLTPLMWWFVVDRVAPSRRRATWWLAGILVTAPWPLVAGVVA